MCDNYVDFEKALIPFIKKDKLVRIVKLLYNIFQYAVLEDGEDGSG